MSESSKLILGAALVAVGFGVATLLGPPQNYSQWQSPLRPTAGQSQSVPPQSLQLRADNDNISEPESSQTVLSPAARPTPQWLAPVSVAPSGMQTGIQPAGLFSDQTVSDHTISDHTNRRTQFASASGDTIGNTRVAPTAPERNVRSASRPVYDVAQQFGPTQSARRPLQDYDDSHWLDDATSNAGEQQHVVADGDTLAELAEIYLGDSQREWEIYHNNRDVLNSPELLPIGAVLTIPARTSAAPSLAAPSLASSPMGIAPVEIGPSPVLDMVPASNQPPSIVSNPVSNPVSSFAVNHQSAISEMPIPSRSIYSSGQYSTGQYSSGQASSQPDLVPVKPVATSTLAPHAHLLTPIPVD